MTENSLEEVREAKPLVLHITNYVTVNDCANITICTGGSPIMTNCGEEIDELIEKASAVVLNIGTVDNESLKLMIDAGLDANDRGIPVILDPVGVGASYLRTRAVDEIMDNVEVALIKGNASEISFLAGCDAESYGVDSIVDTDASIAAKLAKDAGCLVCMTGETDYVSDGEDTIGLSNGSDYMERITGTGCMLTSVCACFLGVHGANIDAVVDAVSAFNIAGELADEMCDGVGTFKQNLFDFMESLDDEIISERKKIE